MSGEIYQLEKKVKELNVELHSIQKEIEKFKSLEKDDSIPRFISYFSYTIMMPNQKRSHASLIGSFIIKNIGSIAINNPIIYLQFEPKQGFSLSGKIGDEEIIDRDYSPIPSMETWRFVSAEAQKKAEEKGEYWLTPVSSRVLNPSQSLSFSNFQIKLDSENIKSKFIGNGFVYTRELEDGQRAMNKINIHY